jgi:hypothetical protein
MPHPNLSPNLNRMADAEQADPKLGEILRITALDAKTKQRNVFCLQVTGWEEQENERVPIYEFLKNSEPFYFYDSDRKTPILVREGSLAKSGVSATHIPSFVLFMIGLGGLCIGRDFSFEYINGEKRFVFAHLIEHIETLPCPEGWTPPVRRIADYLEAVECLSRVKIR